MKKNKKIKRVSVTSESETREKAELKKRRDENGIRKASISGSCEENVSKKLSEGIRAATVSKTNELRRKEKCFSDAEGAGGETGDNEVRVESSSFNKSSKAADSSGISEKTTAGDIAAALDEGYRYGFNDGDVEVFRMDKGISADVVRRISEIKGEGEWMRNLRLKAYEKFTELSLPEFGPDLSGLDFDEMTYFVRATEKAADSWEELPEEISETFGKLGLKKAEKSYLDGIATQYESEVVYKKINEELKEKGVIFLDTDSGLREHPEIFRRYFGKLVPAGDNKFSALNSAVWSGGSFIYVPKGVKLDLPLQSYFRINSEKMGQFERTLIIVDEGADLHYIEGCTAPTYSSDSLHAAVVEIFVEKNARCRYTTIQNWSDNVYNLVTKRALCEEGAVMEWIDGNIGSKVTMKYPACILKGKGSKGTTISIAVADKGQTQDAGSRMIHLAPGTSSTIISKSLARNGGNATYRGTVRHTAAADNARSNVECDTLILDGDSKSDTLPTNHIDNSSSFFQHEATVSKISEEQLFYLMSRGITEEAATEMIIMGFIEPFTKELPMEYAVELNQLMKLDMSGSVG